MDLHSYDVTVIGSGPGGYVAAIRAAQLGKRVAIVERDRLGGVCLNWGCIPTKALLKAAEHLEFLRRADHWGFGIGAPHVDWSRVVARSREAADKLANGVRFLMKKNRVTVFSGTGSLRSANRVEVRDAAGMVLEIQTTHVVLATGARPATLPGVEIDGGRIISSKEAMVLPELPSSILVIGAGAIGLEFAYLYSVFGCRVHLVEYLPSILPGGDEDVSTALARSFTKRGIEVLAGTRVVAARAEGDRMTATVEANGARREITADVALVAVGVRANIDGLGLERLGVRTEKGVVVVDGHCETSVSGIYAIGDVNGPPALAHVASAVEHLVGLDPSPLDRSSIPSCIYCHPQIASVGLTESDARRAGHAVQVGKFPFTANGKAVAVLETEGFVKLVADGSSGEILGAHIFGADATELIGELTLAKASELTVGDILGTIHAHPTMSESILEAAAAWAGGTAHV